MIAARDDSGVPAVDELDHRELSLRLPLRPYDFPRDGDRLSPRCVATDLPYPLGTDLYHAYYAPDRAGCDWETTDASLMIDRVLRRADAYPEYDQLMKDMGDGTVGFRAALVPTVGDDDPWSQFDAHRRMLETELGLRGDWDTSRRYRRYQWSQGPVRIEIDLFVPTAYDFVDTFHEALARYEIVHYSGHSSFGTKDLLTNHDAYADGYQIIVMHGCQSYPYYVRQVFRAKMTDEDPTGHAGADVVATGANSYPQGAPPVAKFLLQELMTSLTGLTHGYRVEARSWLSIVGRMETRIPGATSVHYGVAGVRGNRWQP
jgi:hypothetical protein